MSERRPVRETLVELENQILNLQQAQQRSEQDTAQRDN